MALETKTKEQLAALVIAAVKGNVKKNITGVTVGRVDPPVNGANWGVVGASGNDPKSSRALRFVNEAVIGLQKKYRLAD